MSQLITDIKLTFRNFVQYIPLLKNLVARDLKKKYRKSFLSYAWCILNPLLITLIMYVVFSSMFRNSIENYPVYLFSGRIIFSFIQESTTGEQRSIVGNSNLMRKAQIPYYIFTLSSFFSSVVNMGFSFIAFAVVLLVTGTPITVHWLALPLTLGELFLFSYGLGLLLAVAYVFIRDTNYLYGAILTAWVYLSCIFYPIQQLPQLLQKVIRYLNPAYYFIDQSRSIFLYHQWPNGEMLLLGGGIGLLMMFLGLAAYARTKDKLILYA